MSTKNNYGDFICDSPQDGLIMKQVDTCDAECTKTFNHQNNLSNFSFFLNDSNSSVFNA